MSMYTEYLKQTALAFGYALNGIPYGEVGIVKKHEKTKAEQKKCKSCKYFDKASGCSRIPSKNPLNIACKYYEKRKNK